MDRERTQLRSAGRAFMRLLQQKPMPAAQLQGEETISSDWYVSFPSAADAGLMQPAKGAAGGAVVNAMKVSTTSA